MKYTDRNSILTSDCVECNTELEPKSIENLKDLKFVIGQQYCADLYTMRLLQDLTKTESDSTARLIVCYIYGVIAGKRIERARRKGGNRHA